MSDTEENKEVSSFVSLELDIGVKEFLSIEELQEWVNHETSFFAWMEAAVKKDGNSAHAWNVTKVWLNFINQYIRQYAQLSNNPMQLERQTANLHNQIRQHLQKGHLITSTNPDAIFGKNLSGEEDEVVASYAIAQLLEINTNQNSSKALKGAFLALQYRQGSVATVASQVEALEALNLEWRERFDEQYSGIRLQNNDLIKEVESIKNQFSRLQDEISIQKEEQETALNSMLTESNEKLSDIEKTYDQKLALQSSVQYWKNKRKSNTTVMCWVGGATLILAALTGGTFITAAYKLLQVTLSELQLWKLGVMLAISTFGIWITAVPLT